MMNLVKQATWVLLVSVMLWGCTTTSQPEVTSKPLLNSERIEARFGSYGIDVLRPGPDFRVSNLYSVHAYQKITRTLAVVRYPRFISEMFADQHREILIGGSIGAVFKDAGWDVDKRSLYFGVLPVSEEYASLYRRFGKVSPADMAVYVYELFVEKDGHRFRYAMIAEVYNPEYLNMDDLEALYPDDFEASQEISNRIDEFLFRVRAEISAL